MNDRIRLLVADDHRIVLGGLVEVLRLEEDFDVVASCTNGQQALTEIRRLLPDVAVLDVVMPGMDGITVAREVREAGLRTRIVILTAVLDDDQAVDVARLGIEGVVLKEMPPNLLVECVRSVHQGKRWIEKDSLSRATERMIRREEMLERSNVLSKRELEVLRLVAGGLRSREIAEKIFVSEGTVKFHLHNIYEKLGVRGRMELVNEARRLHLL